MHQADGSLTVLLRHPVTLFVGIVLRLLILLEVLLQEFSEEAILLGVRGTELFCFCEITVLQVLLYSFIKLLLLHKQQDGFLVEPDVFLDLIREFRSTKS